MWVILPVIVWFCPVHHLSFGQHWTSRRKVKGAHDALDPTFYR
jgi:hypothetical protein